MELQRYQIPQAIRHLRICRDIWPRDPEVLLLAARAARCGMDAAMRLVEKLTQSNLITRLQETGDGIARSSIWKSAPAFGT